MKSPHLSLVIVALSLSVAAFAQSDPHAHKAAANSAPATDAQQSFGMVKALAGTWNGKVTIDPPIPDMNDTPMQVTMRVTSRGNALVHEMREAGVPDDPTKYDHPVTMLYLDGDHLTLVHYCDAGNRPRMVARPSAGGKAVEFDLVDISGGTQRGHMHHAVFTVIDANHHIEDWTYMMPGDKPMHAHLDLQRTQTGTPASGE
jgi:hypothetical protein